MTRLPRPRYDAAARLWYCSCPRGGALSVSAQNREVPSSGLQLGMVFGTRDRRPWANVEQCVVQLDLVPDPDVLSFAWSELAQRHDALRMFWVGGRLFEASELKIPIAYHDWSKLDAQTRRDRLDELLEEERSVGLGLDRAPSWQLTLVCLGERRSALVWTVHHSLVDGEAMAIVIRDLADLLAGRPLPDRGGSFRAYLEGLAQRQERREAEQFFVERLGPLDTLAGMVGSVGRPSRPLRGVRHLDEAATRRLREWVGAMKIGLSTAVHAAWSIALARHFGREDVVTGLVVSDRYFATDARSTVGCLINTLPVHCRVGDDLTLRQLCQELRERTLATRSHSYAAVHDIRQWLGTPGSQPLFDTTFMFDRQHLSSRFNRGEHWPVLGVELYEESSDPLALAVYGESRMRIQLEHDLSVVSEDRASALLEGVHDLLHAMSRAGLDDPVMDVPMLSEEARRAVLSLGMPRRSVECPGGLIARFSEIVGETPDAIAVRSVSDGSELRFVELDERANVLASKLVDRGIGEGNVVAIEMERSSDWLACMLAVWKVGAAFVTVDPSYPDEVKAHILRDSGACFTWTPNECSSPAREGALKPPLVADAARPAYVIYTSGSTGTPKGVVVSCGSLAAHAEAIIEAYELSSSDRVLQFASPSFDVSLEEVVPTLLAGGRVVLRDHSLVESTAQLLRVVAREQITVVNLPAGYWHVLVDELERTGARLPSCVRLLVTGSERVDPVAAMKFGKLQPRVRWINAYGPTECTITCTTHEGVGFDSKGDVPIGRPLGHARAYVLAPDGSLAPRGAPGDLWIGGRAVALGYLGKPALTSRVFRRSPFSEGRIYRTGDRARWLQDGELEFLGRADREVKVRGYRIDLRHVERALDLMDGVRRSIAGVESPETPAAKLVAWVQIDQSKTDLTSIKRSAEERLPPHMVPKLVPVDTFPMRPGGKVDMTELWKLTPRAENHPTPSSETTDPRVLAVVDVMARLLGRRSLGPDESFYEAGGHSLLALKLSGALSSELGMELDVSDIHRLCTARAIALYNTHTPAGPKELIAIQPCGHKPPLFGVHVLGRNEEFFRPLSSRLGTDQPMFGLTIPLDESTPSRVEDVARIYQRVINEVCPERPVALAAVSLGAYYAFELARCLEEEGRKVSVLAIFDADGPGGRREARGVERVRRHWRRLMKAGWPHLRAIRDHQLKELVYRAHRAKLRLMRTIGAPVPATIESYVAANDLAVASYKPPPYKGKITVFRALEDNLDTDDSIRTGLGWAEVARGGVEVVDVPGGHLSMLSEPNVATIARALRTRVED